MDTVTIFNSGKGEPTFSRVELDEFVRRLGNGTYRQTFVSEFKKEVCFAAVWQKQSGKLNMKCKNQLVLLSLEILSIQFGLDLSISALKVIQCGI